MTSFMLYVALAVILGLAHSNPIGESPRVIQANEREPFSLKCSGADEWEKSTLQWMRQYTTDGAMKSINNSRITLDPEGTLWFSSVHLNDASDSDGFYYECGVKDKGEDIKVVDRVHLEVKPIDKFSVHKNHPPTQQYVSRKRERVLLGQRAELFCIFSGDPLPHTLWRKGFELVSWDDHVSQGHYGKSVIIKTVKYEDAGIYTCEVRNSVGPGDSHDIELYVEALPYFTREPESLLVADGEEAEFHCEADGLPVPTIHWTQNGQPIELSNSHSRYIVEGNSFVIKNAVKGDSGNYGCNATNSLGHVFSEITLKVLDLPPEIQDPPGKEATVDGKNVIMRCRAFGAPKPWVEWLRNGQALTGGRYTTLPSGDLEIRDTIFDDSGDYTCYATNKFGTKTANGSLIVKQHTKITQPPQDYEVAAGQSATFSCNEEHDPDLDIEVDWYKDGIKIDFENEPRFVKTNDNSLTIAKTIELDSGEFSCVAKTQLDEAIASAILNVFDVPNPPQLTAIQCLGNEAKINWVNTGDQRSSILHYTIQYDTSFTPETWDIAFEKVPSTDQSFTVALSPWANYTFRVIAHNKAGPSESSMHSEVCTTLPDVPYKNPENVAGQGTEPDNLVISWTPMPEIEHNAPNFQYRVSWKRDIPAASWQIRDVYDWHQNSITITGQPTFVRYQIKVDAINERGQANVDSVTVLGYSGEDRPLEAPTNFTLTQIVGSTSAVVSWNSVPEESVRGHFKGYKVQTWTEEEGEQGLREVYVLKDEKKEPQQALVTDFKPAARNYARVLAYNGRFNGPPSAVIDFNTPEGVPSAVQSLDAYPLGSSAFWLTWKKPLNPNGELTGYKIYYEVVKGGYFEERREYEPHISDPLVTHMKMAGLKPNTNYRISIVVTTKEGEGIEYFIQKSTLAEASQKPAVPTFNWELVKSDTSLAKCRIYWIPNIEGYAGADFFTQYRIKGETEFIDAAIEKHLDYQEFVGLEYDKVYEFRVVSVDGAFFTESAIKEIKT